jgi:hypothetical protein
MKFDSCLYGWNRMDLTRDQLLLDLANVRNVLFWMGIAATIVATGVLGYALIKYVQTDPLT